ncbi:MAG: flagellar assembly protein FliH [Cycloclasticus sp.]|jgi:flagellar assembly protein FliH|nr:flagellar assembly protein FliH [Cycloclasticus sp.]MEE4290669.1 flagellar assembly protein FliH [Cycloclasticus sp.]
MSLSKPPTEKDDISSWSFPSFGEATVVDVDIGHIKAPTANDLEKLQQHAIQEGSKRGYEEGLAKGLKAGESKITQQVKSLETIVQALAGPFEEFDERVENEIASLAIQISKQLIRRELKADSGQVVGVVKEAIAALPSSTQNIQLFLHPDDAELVKSVLSLDDDARWKLVEDPGITRGGCRVTTDVSTIDATIENRLLAIIAQALGDERAVP